MSLQEHRDAINKRITLNLLIQGAATHTFFTAHHLVRDRLDGMDPKLIPLYDRTALSAYLNYWLGDFSLILGPPCWFWRRLGKADNVFRHHRLMVDAGRELAYASKKSAVLRARRKRVCTIPGLHMLQAGGFLLGAIRRERQYREQLADAAIAATQQIWGIDRSLLRGQLTFRVEMGQPLPPQSFADATIRNGVVGYSGVVRVDDRLMVEAKAITWVLLAHELTKGVAELVCLHGMADIDDQAYTDSISKADRLSLENWYIQAGGELWRRLLEVAPRDRTLAECLMGLAHLQYDRLDEVTFAVATRDPKASGMLASL